MLTKFLEILAEYIITKLLDRLLHWLIQRMGVLRQQGMVYIIAVTLIATILTGDVIILLWVVCISLHALGL